jgi:DNA-binding NarL/FixJ family response regulator
MTEQMRVTSPAPRIRILIVDDHPIVRFAIRRTIEMQSDLEVCGEADSASAALSLAVSSPPDLAIVDLSLAGETSLRLIQSLREAVPKLRVLVLSVHDEALFADRALRAGAQGYIMKREPIKELIGAIRQVMAGRVYVSSEMAPRQERLGKEVRRPADLLAQLTDRELEVFSLIGRGLSTSAIAEQLRVSIKTIETYRSNIKAKLQLTDAAHLVRFAATWAVSH